MNILFQVLTLENDNILVRLPANGMEPRFLHFKRACNHWTNSSLYLVTLRWSSSDQDFLISLSTHTMIHRSVGSVINRAWLVEP